jgi:hypothetical protein
MEGFGGLLETESADESEDGNLSVPRMDRLECPQRLVQRHESDKSGPS